MAQYYGIVRTDEYLAHYGIRGMKWGVRKAIASGSERRISRQYAKAKKKLAKLNASADANKVLAKADKLDKFSKRARVAGRIGLGAATAGTGASMLTRHLHSGVMNRFHKNREAINSAVQSDWDAAKNGHARWDTNSVKNDALKLHNENRNFAADQHAKIDKIRDASRYVQAAGAGIAGLGYGAAAVSKLRANALRKRATGEKHAAAIARRNEFQKEMNKAFAGTKYGNGKASIKKGTGSVVGVQVGKHFVGVSNKEITNGQRKRIKNYIKNSPRKVSLYRGK